MSHKLSTIASSSRHAWPHPVIVEDDDEENHMLNEPDVNHHSWVARHPWQVRPSRLSECPGNWNLAQIESLKRNTPLLAAAQKTSRLQLVRGHVIKTGQEPLKRGSYGTVWRGRYLNPPQSPPSEVAIKVITVGDEDHDRLLKWMQRMFREIYPVYNLRQHPNIVPIKGYLLDQNSAWIISPWQENGNARQYLRRHNAVDKLKLISDVVAGLCYLHSQDPPIVHGDLNTDNVLIGDDYSAMLTDFGLSRIMEESTGTSFVTSTFIGGSLHFLAPELLSGERRTTQSDIWALGGLILQIASGKRPFHGMEPPRVLASLYNKATPIISVDDSFSYPTILVPVIRGCWSIDTASRLTAFEIAELLQRRHHITP
ncbi:hypothetical protein FRC02_010271 [Tulasnella sp. 418]|nr:hypothetical protein FRC02_010271 [Tulasnella sp. 418]